MANFLHGAEVINIDKGARPIKAVKTAVIGLVGIAPKGAANTPVLVLNTKDAAQFGEEVPGFNIPQALAAIFAQGSGLVIVVNTLAAGNLDAVADEVVVIADGKGKLAAPAVSGLVLKSSDGLTTYVLDEDYSVDAFGNITVLDAAKIADASAPKASYNKLDAASVTAAVINGTVDAETNDRTGAKCFDLCLSLFGFNPKILIAPGYSTLSSVAAEMRTIADKFRAVYLQDAPEGITPADALEGRGAGGAINFNTSSRRAFLLYPMLKAYDKATDADALRPYSAYMAGLIAVTDQNEGYWNSPSNREIKGITGVERILTASISDANTETNLLNEAGITTVFSGSGTGVRAWGNRSAAYPTDTHPLSFLSVLRVADVIHESVENAMLQFIDKPINAAIIDAVVESVNSFIRTLKGRGALIDGSCFFDPAKNSAEQIAAGNLIFGLDFMPPVPFERATFESFVDINLLKNLLK